MGWRRSKKKTRRNPSSYFRSLQTLAGSTRSSFVKVTVGIVYDQVNSHIYLGACVKWWQCPALLQQNASWNWLHLIQWTQLAPIHITTRRPRFTTSLSHHSLKAFHFWKYCSILNISFVMHSFNQDLLSQSLKSFVKLSEL